MTKPFWDGFWSVFRHPVTVYGIGFSHGFVVYALLQLWGLTK